MDHLETDYLVACFKCGVEVGIVEAKETLTDGIYLCRICYLEFTNHNGPLEKAG